MGWCHWHWKKERLLWLDDTSLLQPKGFGFEFKTVLRLVESDGDFIPCRVQFLSRRLTTNVFGNSSLDGQLEDFALPSKEQLLRVWGPVRQGVFETIGNDLLQERHNVEKRRLA